MENTQLNFYNYIINIIKNSIDNSIDNDDIKKKYFYNLINIINDKLSSKINNTIYFISNLNITDNIQNIILIRYISLFYKNIYVIIKKDQYDNNKIIYEDDITIQLVPIGSPLEIYSIACKNFINTINHEHDIIVLGDMQKYFSSKINNTFFLEYSKYIYNIDIYTNPINNIPYYFFYLNSSNISNELYSLINEYKIIFIHTKAGNREIILDLNEYINNDNYIIISVNKNIYPKTHKFFYIANYYINLPILYYIQIIKKSYIIKVIDSCFSKLINILFLNKYIDNNNIEIIDRNNLNFLKYKMVDNSTPKMMNGEIDNFGSNFDWIITAKKIHQNKIIPKTIYIKIDFINYFVNNILKHIDEEFILITGCSDYSPYINFYNEYNIIINNKYLKYWYGTNNLSTHIKMKSYPGGLGSYDENINEVLLSFRSKVPIEKKNKILCIWRTRTHNICGNEYITRNNIKILINNYPNIFDWFEPNLNQEEFYNLLSQYKYVLCPVGNGVDPTPKSFEAIILKTLPIIIKTQNTKDNYLELPSILVNDFSDILTDNFLDNQYNKLKHIIENDDIIYKLTAKYWSDKIINDIL
jgi:hypothetical protein